MHQCLSRRLRRRLHQPSLPRHPSKRPKPLRVSAPSSVATWTNILYKFSIPHCEFTQFTVKKSSQPGRIPRRLDAPSCQYAPQQSLSKKHCSLLCLHACVVRTWANAYNPTATAQHRGYHIEKIWPLQFWLKPPTVYPLNCSINFLCIQAV